MCGIFAALDKSKPIDEITEKAHHACQTMKHRGPDESSKVTAYENIALAHTRLSIIGLDNGTQPIIDDDDEIAVVVNGEFYNYERIKNEMSDFYQFKTDSDSEILIPLYLKYGFPKMMNCLEGEFAFALYDHKHHLLWTARDRFGIRTLCYYKDNEKIIFSSEAKAIFRYGISPAFSFEALESVFTMQYLMPAETMFNGVYQVKPGCFMMISEDDYPHTVLETSYWDMNYPDDIPGSSEEYELNEDLLRQTVEQEFIEAIKKRLRSDVPVCCHLSGGLDSSAVAGVMSHFGEKPLHCFTIAFPEYGKDYDEYDIAKETCKHLGGFIHPIEVNADDIYNNLSDAVFYSEGLGVNGHLSCKYL